MFEYNKKYDIVTYVYLCYKQWYYLGRPIVSDSDFDNYEQLIKKHDPLNPALEVVGLLYPKCKCCINRSINMHVETGGIYEAIEDIPKDKTGAVVPITKSMIPYVKLWNRSDRRYYARLLRRGETQKEAFIKVQEQKE